MKRGSGEKEKWGKYTEVFYIQVSSSILQLLAKVNIVYVLVLSFFLKGCVSVLVFDMLGETFWIGNAGVTTPLIKQDFINFLWLLHYLKIPTMYRSLLIYLFETEYFNKNKVERGSSALWLASSN